MGDAGSDDFTASLATGARLLVGWACVAVAVLDLAMGIGGDRTYLIFHLVLAAGGAALIFFDQIRRRPRRRLPYAVIAASALVITLITALPTSTGACCMSGLAVRHGFPLTLMGWNAGRPHHFSAAHALADFGFWYLAGMILMLAASAARPAGHVPAGRRSTHAEQRATPAAPGTDRAQAADDESVGGLP